MSAPLHVVAAVLRDASGRIVLTERPAHRDFAGHWEFPGGKVEPGEDPPTALRRELDEELGIRAGALRPLIRVQHDRGGRPLLLDVHEVLDHTGEPWGREGQSLRWVAPEQLATLPMPPADLPVVAALLQPPLYAISPEPATRPVDLLLADIDRLLAAGVGRLQLRSKQLPFADFARLAEQVAGRIAGSGVELLLNPAPALPADASSDSQQPHAAIPPALLALATQLGCGLHLTSSQLVGCRRRPLPTGHALAASCHDIADLQQAEALAVDFVVLGPVAPTASHPQATALGWKRFGELRAHCTRPVYALGGLQPTDLAIARHHGAQGVAAIRGLWLAGRLVAASPVGC